MKTIITGFLLLLAARQAAAQDTKPHNPFLGRWRMVSYMKNTANRVDTTKEYDFRNDTLLIMSSPRYKLTSKYTFDSKASLLTLRLPEGKEMKFEIIFISRQKMQWHLPSSPNHDADGIIVRIKDYNE